MPRSGEAAEEGETAAAEMVEASEKVFFFHGDLDLRILEARALPNMDMMSEHLRRCFTVCEPCRSKEPGERPHRRKIITSDPYVAVTVAGATVAKTRVISNSQDPNWEEHFVVPLAHPDSGIEFQVKDNDVFGAQLIGTVRIPAPRILSGEEIEGWFPIVGPSGNPPKPRSALRLRMQFRSIDSNLLYCNGVGAEPEDGGVPNAYFPARRGGSVTLYQDAHVIDGQLPEIPLDGGRIFTHEKCWEDICHAILEAHHLIYIVGWSVYHKIRLVREPTRPLPEAGNLTLGELLKYKSQEGVRVCLLVWDDKTSHDKFFIKTGGVMATHDEELRKFFKNSSVHCALSPRYASNKLSIFKQQVVGTLFTHHQKCVLVDTQGSGNNRKLTAFMGGLDLCDGRYDTPEHQLFKDLDTAFKDDVHVPVFPAGTRGPREPWHDLHCKIEGPAAYDVLNNFEQRWKKATKWWEFGPMFKKVSHYRDDALIKIERISWILSPSPTVPNDDPSLWVSKEDDPEHWHVQIFRSIDSGSLAGFSCKNFRDTERQNLVKEKNLVVDKSIHTAYVKAIRSAQHFIYIENQYFLGSSYAWPSYKSAGADNLIPMELTLKIAGKIRAKERFAVYIVIPMFPEGVPTSQSVQEILYWQGQTISMMYEIIAQEIKSQGISGSSHPRDYLNFYCLGNREATTGEMPEYSSQPADSPAARAQKHQRFMIYVHAKGMIVDDEYVILGSANINQRSMAGSRDTEIAMGAFQPHHTWSRKKRHPHGQIYGYRMSLWAEHLGMMEGCLAEPHNLECIQKVNEIADGNWSKFTAETISSLQGHLLRYPINVDADGKVGLLPGYENFPDLGGKVLGAATNLPDALTT